MSNPVDGAVGGAEPGESKDDVFASAIHDVEEVFLIDLFDVGVESASVVDGASFVCCLVDVADSDEGHKFLGGESMFSDKLPVDARDVSTRVY